MYINNYNYYNYNCIAKAVSPFHTIECTRTETPCSHHIHSEHYVSMQDTWIVGS